MNIHDLQIALKSAGFDPGPLDGILGPQTRAATKAFQVAQGLVADGIAGPKTVARLAETTRTPANIPAALPWLTLAHRLIGVKEAKGSADNPQILGWAASLTLPYDHDEIPWCGLFVAHCIGSALPDEALPDNPLGARNWLKFGQQAQPQLGAVMVFWRGSKADWPGHVAFYWAEDATSYHVLGGNQSDAVGLARIDKSRLLGARWPKAIAPLGLTPASNTRLSLSRNEA